MMMTRAVQEQSTLILGVTIEYRVQAMFGSNSALRQELKRKANKSEFKNGVQVI